MKDQTFRKWIENVNPLKYSAEYCYQHAMMFFRKAQYESAIKLFKMAAEDGHFGAHVQLLNLGEVTKELLDFNVFTQTSMEKVGLELRFNIGLCFLKGIGGIRMEIETALRYLTEAAKEGCVDAQYVLGEFYLELNSENALSYYFSAALQGHADAQYKLAGLLNQEKNDPEAALIWCYVAAQHGHAEAIDALSLQGYVLKMLQTPFVFFGIPEKQIPAFETQRTENKKVEESNEGKIPNQAAPPAFGKLEKIVQQKPPTAGHTWWSAQLPEGNKPIGTQKSSVKSTK